MCSYCCGVNKTEPSPRFSLYLLTHSWVFLPVIYLHPSSLRDSQRPEQTEIPIQSVAYRILCHPSESAVGTVTSGFTLMMMHILPNWHWGWLLSTQLSKSKTFVQIIYFFNKLQEFTLDFTKLKNVLIAMIECIHAFNLCKRCFGHYLFVLVVKEVVKYYY